MIGAMPAVSVRHERRKKKTETPIIKIGSRPNHLLLKPHNKGEASVSSPLHSGHLTSLNNSRAGTPIPGDDDEMIHTTTYFRYGDECFYAKLSLLHFVIFFLLGGLTVLIVGAVQFKKEAGLSYLRYHFLVVGAMLLIIGVFLLVIKCVWFRIPYPIVEFVTSSPNSPSHKGDASLEHVLGSNPMPSASPSGGSENLHLVNRRKFSNDNVHGSPLERVKRRQSSDLREIRRVANPNLKGVNLTSLNGGLDSAALKKMASQGGTTTFGGQMKSSASSGNINNLDSRQSPV
ncbi:hypothetical protein TCAL_15101 [Tigriopus californicus]|uniref:Uncharacterized protein n=1 Tax=Tigriopus californicus TaxID=6832 RepID=A0A553NTM5_TIGCA|nr:uncharacterized protein LOC131892493 isoform X2 [Tigriopus californicus]XP_059098392.1 uncharacterized protein LOC131892493 isoform X2 [Tigriopus californicus]XP_059098401.1 uncharacterized protein LOC131892493 isoform X2 [Tigriopus californicus]TRY68780.1 hypothetical protein TCAL_15101 [Tigriopus californicus]